MPKFRKKPVVIEAFELTDANKETILAAFVPNHKTPLVMFTDDDTGLRYAEITTLEGTHRADLGDYIIRGVAGELYPCKPEIFAATYDAAD